MHSRMTAAALTTLLLAIPATTVAQSADAQTPAPVMHDSGRGWSQSTPPSARAPRTTVPSEVGDDHQAQQATPVPRATETPIPQIQIPKVPIPRTQRGQLLNVKVEFTIADQVGTKPAIKKTMTLVVADGESSRIRTSANYKVTRSDGATNWGRAPLSVDVSPWIEGNKVRVEFSIEYSAVDEAVTTGATGEATVSERLVAVLESGVPMIVAQSSDAVSDRKVTVEIKATILK